MKRKTILFAIAAMAFIAFSCAREELPIQTVEVTDTEEVATRAHSGAHCFNCGFWVENGKCVGCDLKYITCNLCGNYAPWGIGSICKSCNGENPPVDWIDDDPNPGPKPGPQP